MTIERELSELAGVSSVDADADAKTVTVAWDAPASEDGVSFQTIVTLPGSQLYRQGRVRTFAFPETTAKFFRIKMTGAPLGPAATMNQTPPETAREYILTETILHSGARVHRWEEKAGYSFLFEYESVPTPDVPTKTAIMRSNIINLTSKMAPGFQ